MAKLLDNGVWVGPPTELGVAVELTDRSDPSDPLAALAALEQFVFTDVLSGRVSTTCDVKYQGEMSTALKEVRSALSASVPSTRKKVFTTEQFSLRVPCNFMMNERTVGMISSKTGAECYFHTKSSLGYYLHGHRLKQAAERRHLHHP